MVVYFSYRHPKTFLSDNSLQKRRNLPVQLNIYTIKLIVKRKSKHTTTICKNITVKTYLDDK